MEALLLSAYQCGPGMGSVSQIGWEWYSRLSERYQVTLLTHVRNRVSLEQAGAPINASEILYMDTEWFAGPLYRLAKKLFPRSEHSVFLVSSLDYFLFDIAAFLRVRKMQRDGRRWKLLHRVTPVSLAAPTWLCRLGMPVVIGPLNSGLQTPQGFDEIMRQESTWLIQIRKLGGWFDHLIGSTRLATRILTASRATFQGVPARYRKRCKMMLENGVDLEAFAPAPWPLAPGAGTPIKILYVGRLIPLKAVDLLLRALARLIDSRVAAELEIVGDGPMAEPWKALARELGIDKQVKFTGGLPIGEVAGRMRACHVFCLPSVRESGGAVLLEAMSCARPVIAVNFGGPGEMIDTEVGALVEAQSPMQIEIDLAECLKNVAAEPDAWRRRGEAGRQRVASRYSWSAKVQQASVHYSEVLREWEVA